MTTWSVIALKSGVRYASSILEFTSLSVLINRSDSVAKINTACGDDDVCINRATKMECYGDCGWYAALPLVMPSTCPGVSLYCFACVEHILLVWTGHPQSCSNRLDTDLGIFIVEPNA